MVQIMDGSSKDNAGVSQQDSTITVLSRHKRKEMGKLRKRQRIEEAGGIRPRDNHTKTNETQNQIESTDRNHFNKALLETSADKLIPTSNNKSQQINPSKSQQEPTKRFNTGSTSHSGAGPTRHKHRFGRVMEQVPCRNKSRFSTISIAIPGSVVANCQTRELRTQICGQIARAATIYHVDEIIVYDDKLSSMPHNNQNHRYHKNRRHGKETNNGDDNEINNEGDETGQNSSNMTHHHGMSDPHTFMARVLQYCECPQYLRRHFFPMHHDLQFAGLLPPIDAPHHVRAEDKCKYREGVVLEEKYITPATHKKEYLGRLVNCGIRGRPVLIDQRLQPGIRCTVQIDPGSYQTSGGGPGRNNNNTNHIQGKVVSPSAPREENGMYWGYSVRLANSLKEAIEGCPFSSSERYDLKIGTSERGTVNADNSNKFLSLVTTKAPSNSKNPNAQQQSKKKKRKQKQTHQSCFRHALIVFGGISGIEECVDADETLKLPGSDSYKLFDLWVNICPYQGSKTIRTEEAILIALAKMCPSLVMAAADTEPSDEISDDDDGNDNIMNDHDDNNDKNANLNVQSSSKSSTKIVSGHAASTTPALEFSDNEPSEESSDSDSDNDDDSEIDEEQESNHPIKNQLNNTKKVNDTSSKKINQITTTSNSPKNKNIKGKASDENSSSNSSNSSNSDDDDIDSNNS